MTYYLGSLGGKPELWSGSEIVYKQLKPLVILAYLERSGEKLRLDVANIFWPDIDKQDRLTRLSEVLRLIEHAAPGSVLKLDDNKLRANVSSDVQDLKVAIEQENYDFVLEIYRGHFLNTVEHNKRLNLLDALEAFDWLLAERESTLDMTRAAILDFAEIKAAQEHYSEAAELALKAYDLRTEQSFLLEQSYQRIYTLLCAAKDAKTVPVAKEAIQMYDAEAIVLFDSFQDARKSLATPNNLPQVSDTLVGRQGELEECAALLRGDTRLLTLIGPAGTGKTEFSKKLSQNLRGYGVFKDGIYALWLEQLSNPEDVVTSIAQCLNISISTNKTPLDTVADALGDQAILFYLDNFEHLLEATSDLDQLLARCPNLRIVLSSREVVISDWAKLYDLHGLDFPDENTVYEFEDVGTYAAVELVVAQGKRVNNSFELSEDNFEAVVAICQQVGGLALGLKLAASWLHSSSAQAIAEELKGSMALLDTVQHNQRGVSAALELSWQRLIDAEQDAFCKLAVFNGGFDLQAAQSICEIELTELSSLQNKSLIEWDAAKERYSFHPLIRRFVELKAEASVAEGLKLKHGTYYLKLLRVITDGTQEERNGAVRLLKPEIYNIQDAWQQVVDSQDLDELRHSAHAVERFFDEITNYIIGSKLLQNAINSLREDIIEHHVVLGSLVASQAWLYYRLSNYYSAIEFAEQAMKLCLYNFQEKSTALNVLGTSHKYLRNYDLARKYFKEGLLISKKHSGHYATVLSNMVILDIEVGKFDLAEKHLLEALAIRQKEKQLTRLPSTYYQLGLLKLHKEEFTQAKEFFINALEIADTLVLNHWITLNKGCIYYIELLESEDQNVEDLFKNLILESRSQKKYVVEVRQLLLMSRVLHHKNRHLEALEHLEIGLKICRQANLSFLITELVIVFLKVCKDFVPNKSSKLYSLLMSTEVLRKMNYLERTELEGLDITPNLQTNISQFAQEKIKQILIGIEQEVKQSLYA